MNLILMLLGLTKTRSRGHTEAFRQREEIYQGADTMLRIQPVIILKILVVVQVIIWAGNLGVHNGMAQLETHTRLGFNAV